jgi:hypothetical protein
MLGRVGSILPVALAALVVALPAAPAAAAKCRPLHDQKVIARSARAVLLGRSEPQWGYRLWGCSRRTGTRRLLATSGGDRELKSPMLRGTHVGLNLRREFFYATPEEVRAHLVELTGELLQYDDFAEAVEFRQSQGQAEVVGGASGGAGDALQHG